MATQQHAVDQYSSTRPLNAEFRSTRRGDDRYNSQYNPNSYDDVNSSESNQYPQSSRSTSQRIPPAANYPTPLPPLDSSQQPQQSPMSQSSSRSDALVLPPMRPQHNAPPSRSQQQSSRTLAEYSDDGLPSSPRGYPIPTQETDAYQRYAAETDSAPSQQLVPSSTDAVASIFPSRAENESMDVLIIQVERLMREYEQNAQYADAERTRQHLENLRRRKHDFSRRELEVLQEADIRTFFHMVSEQQTRFDRAWASRLLEHKLRADDLIQALQRKQQQQQEDLYRQLQQKRVPRFSVELLNLRKRQVLLARGKKYIEAEELRRKADQLELVELDRIRRAARQDNQAQFEALLKRQQLDRHGLASRLKDERMHLLELKAQDFIRLRNRLKTAEVALKRTHVRQGLVAEGKLAPVFSTLNKKKLRKDKDKEATGQRRGSAKPGVRALLAKAQEEEAGADAEEQDGEDWGDGQDHVRDAEGGDGHEDDADDAYAQSRGPNNGDSHGQQAEADLGIRVGYREEPDTTDTYGSEGFDDVDDDGIRAPDSAFPNMNDDGYLRSVLDGR